MSLRKNQPGKATAPRGYQVFQELADLVTEKTNSRTRHIDRLNSRQILSLINHEDTRVAEAVAREIPYIAQAVELVVERIKMGGRLFYIGAGTSGRLGVLDAAECPPTFGTDPKMIVGIIAGGRRSLIRSREGVEDDLTAARKDIARHRIGPRDIVVGISASKRTPYTLEGLREAHRRGAATVFISCNPRRMAAKEFDVLICPVVGPEVIAGSSRMKAGTAQKMILNMITTTVMIRTGRIYGNRMVELMATSEKLKERAKRALMDVCDIEYARAAALLKRARGHVKSAIIMHETGVTLSRARQLLEQADGFADRALKSFRKKRSR